MANTYSSAYFHAIFAVKNREALIIPTIRNQVHKYISGIINGEGHKCVQVGGPDNHIHILFRYNINKSAPELIKQIKINTTRWLNRMGVFRSHFSWQDGYALFSVGPLGVEAVKNYILNQNEHHRSMSLRDEARLFLQRFGIEFDERYILADPT